MSDYKSLTELRKLLLANGYVPLLNKDKIPAVPGWQKLKVTAAVIDGWDRSAWLGTGLRVEPPLMVIDSDVGIQAAQDAIEAAWAKEYPGVFDTVEIPLLRRGNSVNAKLAFFVRCNEVFGRIHTARWLPPGGSVEDGGHGVEIFAGGSPRQFGAYGPHGRDSRGQVVSTYVWSDDAPHDVPCGKLPLLTKADAYRLCDIAEGVFRALGWTRVERTKKGENAVDRVYDLTEDMRFDCIDGCERTLSELRLEAPTRCSASWLVPGVGNRTRCLVGLDHDGGVTVWDSESYVTHHEAMLAPNHDDIGVAPMLPFETALKNLFLSENKDIRYISASGRWHIWNGTVWAADELLEVRQRASELCHRIAMASTVKTARIIGSARTVFAVETLARSEPGVATSVDRWDADPYLLTCQTMVVDLRTGHTRAPRKEDLCTRQTRVDPVGGPTPLWTTFINEVTGGDAGRKLLLQQIAGYCLVGDSFLQKLFFFHGKGANGKSTFIGALSHAMGSYAGSAAPELLMERFGHVHPTELARLKGMRLVFTTEISTGQVWNEGRIKILTGGDTITARFMHRDEFEFIPAFTILISGNNRPTFRVVDLAIKRRMILVPWDIIIPPERQDEHFRDKLKAEAGGILQWAIVGLLNLLSNGLQVPADILRETYEYLEGEDLLQQWIDECPKTGMQAASSSLFHDWERWCGENASGRNEYKTIKRFSMALQDRGFRAVRKNTGMVFLGIGLKSQTNTRGSVKDDEDEK